MTGVAIEGAQVALNNITNLAVPVVSNTAPAGSSWFPGLYWINSSVNPPTVNNYNGVSWSVLGTSPWLALLTADPTGVTTISGLTECVDSGYARQPCTFTQATNTSPSTTTNASLIQFGPFNVNMSLPVQWLALVTGTSSVNGFIRQTWTLSQQWQVLATQVIDIPAGALTITMS